jgi:hypothetical protein
MKRICLAWFLVFLLHRGEATNLVPNNSFESNSAIPTGYGQWYDCSMWNDVNNHPLFAWPYASPDYMHTSATSASGVKLPSTTFGTISAHTGNAVMGLAMWLASTANFREYISIQLTSAMTIGTAYEVSFYITNGTNNYNGSSCDHICVDLSTAPLTQVDHEPINVTPECDYASQLWNTGWTQISFQFTPTDAYQYITIGHFKDDANTAHTYHGPGGDGAYYFIDDVVVQPLTTLPVELISFSGMNVSEGNLLEWQTASEFNTDHFVVERSDDGTAFAAIGEVIAAGFSGSSTSYSFVDERPFPDAGYYRLRIVDRDGAEEYSHVILVSGSLSAATFQAMVIPEAHEIRFYCYSPENTELEYLVFNSQGILQEEKRRQPFSGGITLNVNTRRLSAGTYVARVQFARKIFTQKFTVY